ncbi:MAG TPA: SRPBCC domain-containing protein [Solirubrobacterales bacterium]|jgi:uncharacterized protein YndB with AHSA1/START domain
MDELTLKMNLVLPAPAPAVFDALTDPSKLVEWFGPQGFTIPAADFHPRVGARYRIEMQPPDGEAFFLAGEFREVDAPNRLVYTFAWEDPDPEDVENVVSLSLAESGATTELAFTQAPFTSEGRYALHRDGWTDSLEKLAGLVSARA